MPENQRLQFLRVLIAAAWADGDILCEEMNSLKEYFRTLDLSDEELSSLEIYFADPIESSEAETIIHDFLDHARKGEVETLVAAVRDLLVTDGELQAGESEFLKLLAPPGGETATVGVFVSRLKRLWANPRRTRAAFRRADLLDEFVKNRVYYQIKRRLLIATGRAELDEDMEIELRHICAVGALLGHVAGTDRHFSGSERKKLLELLDGVSSLHERDLDILIDIVKSEVLSDIGYLDFARELNELATRDERIKLVRMLFEIAAADGEISHREHEEIRKIAKALQVEHDKFIAAKQEVQS